VLVHNAPCSTLPRAANGDYLPDPAAIGPHTRLGVATSRKVGLNRQGATFDGNGRFLGRTDVTSHGRDFQIRTSIRRHHKMESLRVYINRLNIDQENCTMKNWYLFEYALKTNDTESISDGKFLLPLFQFLHGEKNYDYCIISNIDGGFDCDKNDQYIHELLANRYGGNVFDYETFVKLVNKILVLDWGDFFSFSSRPDDLMFTFKSML
jgi:hypothetical protein